MGCVLCRYLLSAGSLRGLLNEVVVDKLGRTYLAISLSVICIFSAFNVDFTKFICVTIARSRAIYSLDNGFPHSVPFVAGSAELMLRQDGEFIAADLFV